MVNHLFIIITSFPSSCSSLSLSSIIKKNLVADLFFLFGHFLHIRMALHGTDAMSFLLLLVLVLMASVHVSSFSLKNPKILSQSHLYSPIASLQAEVARNGEVVASDKEIRTTMTGNADARSIVFGGIRFFDPIARSLESMRINTPTAIQSKALVPLVNGISCILHAETGSGKTLCYLLPLLKQIIPSPLSNMDDKDILPTQAMIVVPTKELAIQVAADVASLLSKDQHNIDTRKLFLSIHSGRAGLDEVRAPIVIGTPFSLRTALENSSPDTIRRLKFVVMDEIDRMLQVTGKYASNDKKRAAKSNENPAADLILRLGREVGFRSQDDHIGPNGKGVQLVAASATIGRPMRRELYRLLLGGAERSPNNAGELPIIRSRDEGVVIQAPVKKEEEEKDDDDEAILNSIKEAMSEEGQNDEMYDLESLMMEQFGTPTEAEPSSTSSKETTLVSGKKQGRAISIPESIRHICILMQEDTDQISTKLSVAQKLWNRPPMDQAKRGLLFVPKTEDVKHAMGMLNFWGMDEIRDLQQILGINQTPSATHNKKGKPCGRKGREEGGKVARNIPVMRTSTLDLVERAASTKLGAASRLDSEELSIPEAESERELYIMPVSGMRGLHLQDVEYVIVTVPPKTMDEYLHVAGRTGREGNSVRGTVVTLVNYDELKRMQSWQTPLNIQYEVEYE